MKNIQLNENNMVKYLGLVEMSWMELIYQYSRLLAEEIKITKLDKFQKKNFKKNE